MKRGHFLSQHKDRIQSNYALVLFDLSHYLLTCVSLVLASSRRVYADGRIYSTEIITTYCCVDTRMRETETLSMVLCPLVLHTDFASSCFKPKVGKVRARSR
jgi:hypothetical protein